MLKVFIAICCLMPWFSIGSMNMKNLEKGMEEIRKIESQTYDLWKQIEDLNNKNSEYNMKKTKFNDKKQELNAEKLKQKTVLDEKKKDLNQQKILLKEEKQSKLQSAGPSQKSSIKDNYAQRIGQIDTQKDEIDIKKGQLGDEFDRKKEDIDIQKDKIDVEKDKLNVKKIPIQNEMFTLSETKIEKQIKVTKLMEEEFKIFESKIDDERKPIFTEQKKSIFESMKKNFFEAMKKNENSNLFCHQINNISTSHGTNVKFGNITDIKGSTISSNSQGIFVNGKRYPPGNMSMTNGKIYINGKDIKQIDEEEDQKRKDKNTDESECIVDIEVLEESYKFLIHWEKNCEEKPNDENNILNTPEEIIFKVEEKKIEHEDAQIQEEKIEIDQEKIKDTLKDAKIKEDDQENTNANPSHSECNLFSCCKNENKNDSIQFRKE